MKKARKVLYRAVGGITKMLTNNSFAVTSMVNLLLQFPQRVQTQILWNA
eukprot:CAMPEP_0184005330 /NCGR_PEP_ID=MMETSP0954-20121128/7_1 /TAXON_ID=627963 /ORGANISM="Aplanochytrium sp, Strain PBS07" /LENGTH=48 /DNA_ID= /DNA_START= /DNA_END= /DNA_ORIENTATION=